MQLQQLLDVQRRHLRCNRQRGTCSLGRGGHVLLTTGLQAASSKGIFEVEDGDTKALRCTLSMQGW